MNGYWRPLLLFCVATGFIFVSQRGLASPTAMKGPPVVLSETSATGAVMDEPVNSPMLGLIRFFQQYISPIDGARCQFTPTCSAFGHQAIRQHGPGLGLLMTSDRLVRCSDWADPSVYPHLTNGRLSDPVAGNLGWE